jgi:hypothetical protein
MGFGGFGQWFVWQRPDLTVFQFLNTSRKAKNYAARPWTISGRAEKIWETMRFSADELEKRLWAQERSAYFGQLDLWPSLAPLLTSRQYDSAFDAQNFHLPG